MLACIRLGAVLIPATTLLSRDDVADRIERGRARAVVAATEDTPRFADVADDCLKIGVDLGDGHGEAPGWEPYALTHDHATLAEVVSAAGEQLPVTRPDDTLLLYFTSGTTAQPKLVEHTHASYPIGHLSTMYWIGLQPGDVHLNVSSSGWAKHAWSCFFAPFTAGATVLVFGYPRFDPQALLRTMTEHAVTTFCAPPTVWRMLVQEDLVGLAAEGARAGGRRRAAQPRGDREGARRLGHHRARRLRPDRDHRAGGQPAGAAGQARLDGPPAAGLLDRAGRPGHRRGGRRRRGLCRAVAPAGRCDGRLRRRPRADHRGDQRRRLPHRRRREPGRGRLPDLRGQGRRRVQGQ